MGRTLRKAGVVALVLGLFAGLTTPAGAAARVRKPPAPPPPKPGWLVDTITIESLNAAAPITVTGVGAYPGRIVLARTIGGNGGGGTGSGGGVGVRNDVPLESYVRGISEVPSSWPFEALKAQAIAARTYALYEASRPIKSAAVAAFAATGADICATESCQVYTGVAKVQAPDGDRWAAAVESTRGQVLWWRDGPINAKYSSSNGGLSIPGGQPYLRSVADPDDVYSPLHHWQVSLGFDAIGRALGMTATPTLMQRIGDTIVVTAASTDLATPPEVVTLQASEFGEKVNTAVAPPPGMPRTLPSTRFDVVPAPGGVLLDGRAFGHSIGMSQWGAYGKAARGMKAPDILAAYYGGLKPLATPVAGLADATMRVAVGVDLQTAEVDAGAGAVRMVAGDGAVIAYAARGPWQVKPEGTRLRVVPPTDQLAAQPVAQVSTSPAEPHPGQPITVKVHLPEPAVVTATATAPNAEVVTLADPQLLAAGDVALHLPPAATSGQYAIAVTTDLGGGRTSTTTLVVPIGSEGSSAPRRAATRVLKTGTSAPAERGAPHGAAIALALLALIGVAVTTLRFGARSRSPLH